MESIKNYRIVIAKDATFNELRAADIVARHVRLVVGVTLDIVRDDELLVFASADVLFRCKIDELEAWELLSKDGVVLTGPDLEHGGVERTVIAFYVYYRK